MNQDNLSLYSIFLTVARSQSILSASEKLYISQPAVSKSIKRLESNLHTLLFIRTPKGVELTEEGHLLYEQISSAFELIQDSENTLLQRKQLGMGRIKIGVSNTLCKYVLLPFLSEYSSLNPHVNISIECQSSGDTLKMLTGNHIDIGLVARPNASYSVVYHSIGAITDTFVATPTYLKNMQKRTESITPSDKKANIMMLNQDNITRQYVDQYVHKEYYQNNNLIETDSMDLLIEFAKTGIGIGCVIKEFVKQELSNHNLIEYQDQLPSIPQREVCLAYSSIRKPSLHTMNFMDYVLSEKNNPLINILASH